MTKGNKSFWLGQDTWEILGSLVRFLDLGGVYKGICLMTIHYLLCFLYLF